VTDSRFWDAVQATFTFTVASVFFEFLIGLGFALLMNQAFRGRGVTRAAILVPVGDPDGDRGADVVLHVQRDPGVRELPARPASGSGTSTGWANPAGPWFAIIFADVWKTAPFVALLLLAGLQTIPGDVYESAAWTALPPGSGSGTSRCRCSSRRSWSRCCSAPSTPCACTTCRRS
jgi:multiple sugar transport system permease protein